MCPSDPFQHDLTRLQPALKAFITSLIPGDSAVNDVIQETNRVLCRKRDQFEAGTNFRAWAFTIARFQILAYLKKRKRDRLVFEPDMIDSLAHQASGALAGMTDRAFALRHCLEKLDPEQRDLLQYRYERSGTLKQYRHRNGRSENALKLSLLRIREQLRACIEHHLNTE